MNVLINQHFTMIEMQLLQSSAVVAYDLLSREVGLIDGKLRIKATLRNQAILELFEYDNEIGGQIQSLKYSFHWQNAQGLLKKRWDNAPHYPHLPNAPPSSSSRRWLRRGSCGYPDRAFCDRGN